jgi:Na+/melibiose symporter-like transporter
VLCYAILNLLVLSTLNYFATYVLGASSSATMIMAVYLVMSLIFSVLSVPIDRKLDRKDQH